MKSSTRFAWAAAATALTAVTVANWATTRYWHHYLPNRLYRRMQTILAARGPLTGGWIDMTPQAGYVDDHLVAAYHGGITVQAASGSITYEFDIAETGAVTHLAQSPA